MRYLRKVKQYIPVITGRTTLSIANPLPWYFIITTLLLIYISIGDHNKEMFFSIFHLTGHTMLLDGLMKFSAAYLFILILAIGFLWICATKKGRYVQTGISFIAVGAIAYILAKISTHLIIDIRPYIEYHLTPLISVAKDNGFPSDHALLSMAIAAVTSLYSKTLGWVLFTLALIVSFARIYVAAHHPLDIIGSMVIVALSTCIFVFILKKLCSLPV